MQKFRQMARRAVGTAAALALMLLCARAQTGGIRGRVADERQNPLSGASVSIRELNRSAATGEDGGFAFDNVPAGLYTIAVSYVGYAEVQRRVSVGEGTAVLDVAFRSAGTQDLDEVVVIGYGTVRKRDLTGSVVSVGEKDFNKGVQAAPDQLIQGKAAGVMVVNNSGRPGGSTSVRIRGNSSLRSGNEPLFVVDGIPLSGGSARPGSGQDFDQDGGNPLAYLNPNDIASMDVLKDASATAIYGSRGANGVVIITTKRGRAGAPQLGVTASTGTASLMKKIPVLTATEYREAIDYYGVPKSTDEGGNEDALAAIMRTAVSQNHALDVSGGTEAGRYRVSAGYFDNQGIIGKSNLKKLTASLNGSFSFLDSKKLVLDLGILATQSRENIVPIAVNGSVYSVIRHAMEWNPTRPLHQPDGSLTYYDKNHTNPLATLEAIKDEAQMSTVIANLSPSYRITDHLVYKFTYGLTQQYGRRTSRFIKGLMDIAEQTNGEGHVNNNTENNHQLAHTLSFDREVASGLNINALVGYEYLSYDRRTSGMTGKGFSPLGDIEYYDYLGYAIANNRGVASYRTPTNELQSYFARVALNWQDRYLFTGTVRRDGSSKFGTNNKYATFPSLALAWNIHNEAFLKENALVSSLKLRGGWGKTGNSEFPSGASRDRYIFGAQSVSQANFGNPNLRWESSATVNVGVDFGLFAGRLSGSVEYFDKRTTDALFERVVAAPAPSGRVWVNLDGEIRNHGVELALQGAIVQKEDWEWSLGANGTWVANMVSGMPEAYEAGGWGLQQIENGYPMNTWYTYKFVDIDPATGKSRFEALDGSVGPEGIAPGELILSNNRHYLGSALPRYLLGISTSARWKRLTATLNANGTFGHWIRNGVMSAATPVGLKEQRNMGRMNFNRSVRESLDNDLGGGGSRLLEKGDYLKFANFTLNYNLGTLAGGLRNFNVSLTGQNLFILTGYKGIDPEAANAISGAGIPQMGYEDNPYPSARTFVLGVNFSL